MQQAHHQPTPTSNAALTIPSGTATSPPAAAAMPDLPRAALGDAGVAQLTAAMQQLQVQFGAIAGSLALVVDQLAQLTKSQQTHTQPQPQQQPTSTTPRSSLLPQPGLSLPNTARPAEPAAPIARADAYTTTTTTTTTMTTPAGGGSHGTPPTFHDDLPMHSTTSRSPDPPPSPPGAQPLSDPEVEEEQVFGPTHRSQSGSPSHSRSRSRSRSVTSSRGGGSGRSSEDEEGSPQANRVRKAQDDELENEVSSKAYGSGRDGGGGGGGKERSLSSRQKDALMRQSAKVMRALPHVSETSQMIAASAASAVAVNSAAGACVGGIDLANILLLQQQHHHSPRTMSMPTAPAGLVGSTVAHPPQPFTSHHHHGHTSPTVLPSMYRTARGTSTASISTTSIPASATALPLDAPESSLPQGGGSATASPRHHAMHGSMGTSPIHMLNGAAGAAAGGVARSSYHAATSPRSLHGSHGGGSSTTSPLHRGQSHSVSVDGGGLTDLHAAHIFLGSENKIKLNVGGQLFCTTLSTLLRESTSMFSAMFGGRYAVDLSGPVGGSRGLREAVFIDRDPTMFRHVLNYLRDGSICLDGMTSTQKKALIKEARYFALHGLLALLQLDSRATKTAQRRELSSEKEYKLVEDVAQKDLAHQIKEHSLDGYEFENWLPAVAPVPLASLLAAKATSSKAAATLVPAHTGCVHLLFSKKLSRGELMLLDRLQNHM